MSEAGTVLTVDAIVGGYSTAEQILKGTSLRVERGEIVTIIGPNGAGKSTLLKAVAGLLTLSAGSITLNGRDVSRENALGRARHGMSFVPQERNVFGPLTVAENLSISALPPPGPAPSAKPMRCTPATPSSPPAAAPRPAPSPAGNARSSPWQWAS